MAVSYPRVRVHHRWKAGATVEVSWAIEANHGGGYQYRLCKVDDPLGAEKPPPWFSLSRPCLSLRLSRACLGKTIAVS